MIKFWKSAGSCFHSFVHIIDVILLVHADYHVIQLFSAKGKSGCPVRPPEALLGKNSHFSPLDTTDLDEKNDGIIVFS